MAGDLSALGQVIVDAVETVSGLSHSKQLIDAAFVPQTSMNRRFSVDIQSSNTEKYRDSNRQRLEHLVTVSVLFRINPLDQWTSYKSALDTEELIVEKLLDQSQMPAYRGRFRETSRELTGSREYLLTRIVFSVEHSHSF